MWYHRLKHYGENAAPGRNELECDMEEFKIGLLLPIIFSVCFILSIPNFLSAQSLYQGQILNAKTGNPIPYITIKLIKENLSVSADENGYFVLKALTTGSTDSLLFKGIGYTSKKISTSSYNQPLIVHLNEDVNSLNEVAISFKKISKQLNQFKKNNFTAYLFKYQIAQEFDRPTDCHFLKSVSIGINTNFFGSNLKSKFRIRVYDQNPFGGGPGEDLCLEKIEVNYEGSAMLDLDLTKYKILIPHSKFFVAIEKLLIPYNERYRLHRDVTQNTQKADIIRIHAMTYNTYYEPVAYFKKTKERLNWSLDYVGDKWKARLRGVIGISALITN